MDYVRALYSNAWRNIIFGSSDYWSGLLSFSWLWSCLSLSRLIGIEVPDGIKSWVYSWHIEDTKPHSLMFWELVRPAYGLVLSHFGPSRIATWGIMFSVCNGYVSVQEGTYVLAYLEMLSPYLIMTFSWLVLSRLWFNYWILLPLLFGLVGVNCSITYYLVANFSCVVFNLSFSMSFAQSIPLILFGCDDRDHVYHPSDTRLCSWGPIFCKNHHGYLLRLHLYMTEKFPHREKITISLMRFFADHSKARFEIFLNWVPPLLLLSLLLVIMYA